MNAEKLNQFIDLVTQGDEVAARQLLIALWGEEEDDELAVERQQVPFPLEPDYHVW